MQRFLTIALVLWLMAAWPPPGAAQTTREHILGGRAMTASGAAPRKITSSDGSDEARAVVQRIVSVVGLPSTNFEVRASSDVANAEATTENDGRDRLIIYNPVWMERLKSSIATDWTDWVVLAHEVGHHVAFHMDPSFPNHEAELQADYFAGFILNRLGAPLPEVQLAMAMVSSDIATRTHPARSERVAEVKKGWQASQSSVGANVIPAAMSVPARPAQVTTKPEQRAALLIGNTHYKSWGSPLKNPKNDVIAIGQQLRKLGFATTIIYDGTAEQISTAIRAFRDEAAGSDWAMIYYAGTGIEVDGINYMIPIDANDKEWATFTRDHAEMRIDTAFESVKPARHLRLVVADSCRVDPSNLLRAPGGLRLPQTFKVVEPPNGVVVAYSTAAGQYAQDGQGELSPYAKSMIEALREPGIEIPKVFRKVSAQVERATQGVQIPTVLGNWPDDDLYVSVK